MAIVPVSLQGSIDLTAPIDPSNFNLIAVFNGSFTTQSGMNAVSGIAAIQAYLESFFTGILSGTIISSSVTYTSSALQVNIQGTGVNDSPNQPAAIMNSKAISDATDDVIAFYYGTTECPDPLYQNPAPGCQSCIESIAGDCDDVVFALDFDPDTVYQVHLIDFFGGIQRLQKTSNSSGEITIEADDFIDGANTDGALPIQVIFYTEANALYTFAVGDTAYTCVNLKFKLGADDTVPAPTIGNAQQV